MFMMIDDFSTNSTRFFMKQNRFFIVFAFIATFFCADVMAQKPTKNLSKPNLDSLSRLIPIPSFVNQTHAQLGKLVVENTTSYRYGSGRLEYNRELVGFGLPTQATDLVLQPLRQVSDFYEDEVPAWIRALADDYFSVSDAVTDIEDKLGNFKFGLNGVANKKVRKFSLANSTTIRFNHDNWRWLGLGFALADTRVGSQNPYFDPANMGRLVTIKGLGALSVENFSRSDRGAKSYTLFVDLGWHDAPFFRNYSTIASWENRRGNLRQIRWMLNSKLIRSYDGSLTVGAEFFLGDEPVAQLINDGIPPFVAQSLVNYLSGDGLPTLRNSLEDLTLWGGQLQPSVFFGGETGGLRLGYNAEFLFGKVGTKMSNHVFDVTFVKSGSLFGKKQKK